MSEEVSICRELVLLYRTDDTGWAPLCADFVPADVYAHMKTGVSRIVCVGDDERVSSDLAFGLLRCIWLWLGILLDCLLLLASKLDVGPLVESSFSEGHAMCVHVRVCVCVFALVPVCIEAER